MKIFYDGVRTMFISNVKDYIKQENYFPLTSYQMNTWLDQCRSPDKPFYNIGGYMEIIGKVDCKVFQDAVNQIIRDNDALRIAILEKDGEPLQVFLPELKYNIVFSDFSQKENPREYSRDWMNKEFLKPFDIDGNILFHFQLIKEDENLYYYFAKCHHLIMDGWSFSILAKRFKETYSSLIQQSNVEKEIYSYKDFIHENHEYLNSEKYKSDRQFWAEKLKILPEPIITRKTDVYSKEENSVSSARKTLTIKRELYNQIIRFCGEKQCSMFHFFLGVLSVYFGRVYSKNELIIGVPILNRRNGKHKSTIGLFMNVIPLKVTVGEKLTFINLMTNIKNELRECYRHHQLSLGEIISLSGNKVKNNEALYEIFFSYMKQDNSEKFNNYPAHSVMLTHQNERSALSISVSEFDDKQDVNVDFDYQIELFDSNFPIENVVEHFNSLLYRILENYDQCIYELELISDNEKQKILYDFNDSEIEYPKNKVIHELFEEQVERTPDNIAISFMDKTLTYRELNQKSNCLARVLRSNGVKPDTIIGIMVERSVEMIVGILSILKAGGAYLPIDPTYPKDRISYMLEDSGTNILLTQNSLIDKFQFCGNIISIEDENIYKSESSNLENINSIKDLVYVIYTSGTTGKPKGVMVEHKNFINISYAWKNEYGLEEMEVKLLQMASFSFDVFSGDISRTLLNGGKMVICPSDVRIDPQSLYLLMRKENINIFESTPSLVIPLMDYIYENNLLIDNLKLLIVGSDSISMESFDKLCKRFSGSMRIINSYGVTEATIDSSYYEKNIIECKVIGDTPIGKPLQNTQFYILDANMMPRPIGIYGELLIGGAGVTRGYINKPEITKEKFISNPFIPGEIIYRTGDLSRWLPDGNMEFLGRIDNQVKIRGYRIELGEIESKLESHASVKEAVVIPWGNSNDSKYLCGYITVRQEVTTEELKAYLSGELPYYMIPSRFVILQGIPLTPNGKVDRKALPEPEEYTSLGENYQAPSDRVEEELVHIWQNILDMKRIGVNDNFFDLGGHSLKVAVMVSMVHKKLNVEVPLREVFKSATIKQLSEYIKNSKVNIYSSIKPLERKEYYPSSSAQKRLYIISQLEGALMSYNMPEAIRIEGKLSRERLEVAFMKLIQRHESLRTSFEFYDGELVQKIHDDIDFHIEFGEAQDDKTAKIIADNFVEPFDLNKLPLIRVKLVKINDENHILLFDMHHIISDGVSMGILINELINLYKGKDLPRLRIQYKDYATWQNLIYKQERIKIQEEYWINVFKDEIPVLNIPTDYPRPPGQSFEGDRIEFEINPELTGKLKRIAADTGTTLYMVLLSAYNVLLSKYSGQEDIVVGTPIAGRPHSDLHNIIGMFVNTLAMRNNPANDKMFSEFLMEVKENSLKAYENQDYQFEELIERLPIKRDLSRNPLFDTMFVLQNTSIIWSNVEGLKFTQYNKESQVAKFDLTLNAIEAHDNINFTMEYCTRLFKKETIEKIIGHFTNILKSITNDIEVKLSEIKMLTKEEEYKLLYEINDTNAKYTMDKVIHELFEEQVERTPDNIAVVFDGMQLTYEELNKRANSLAQTLREKGVKPDSIVAMIMECSLEMIVGIIAILKAGGAYLPIDPEYPEDRIKYTLEDSKPNIVLTQLKYIGNIKVNAEILNLEDERAYAKKEMNLKNVNIQRDLAYIIYTSGTTGKPKGVMIEHKNVVRLLFNEKMQFDFNNNDIWTMFHSYCFDFSVWEMYGALLYGGKLILISKDKARVAEEYLKILKEEQVTVLNQIPTPFYNLMNEELNYNTKELQLRYIIFGGEALKPEMLKGWIKKYPETKLINMYGITETTVHVTYKNIAEEDINAKISNIGKPLPTILTYIMDKNLKLQPIGVPGEICIGGSGVARGYLNKPELTKEKFVYNPYKRKERIYRSGDLARILENGEIEYLGRIDNQVKIRGFRIEIGEIESQLLRIQSIRESIIIEKEDNNGCKYLCAYIVADRQLTVEELRKNLSKNLPEYMIPSNFIQLERMPLTTTGKIDRTALPKPNKIVATGKEYEPPKNTIEKRLVEIWEEIIGIDKISINDNFFEIGGHSLKAATLISKVKKKFNVKMPLREVFNTPTIKQLAKFIEGSEENICTIINPVEEQEYYEISSIQRKIYATCQIEENSTAYNMPSAILLEGDIDNEGIKRIFNILINRHETLRTSFDIVNGNVVQKVHKNINFKVDCIENEEYRIDEMIKEFIQPFNLHLAPLIRAKLIKKEDNKFLLLFDMHHIISDGVTIDIFVKEFVDLYRGIQLPPLNIQYKDFVAWQNKFQNSKIIKRQEEYWMNIFRGNVPVLNIPTDFPRGLKKSFEGGKLNFQTNRDLTVKLKKLKLDAETTLYMVLFAAYNVLLFKYTGQEDIIVGIPMDGRYQTDFENTIGMFVNILPARNYPTFNKSFDVFLNEIKENILNIYENQYYTFDDLLEKLEYKKDVSRNSIFDTVFMLQNDDISNITFEDIKVTPYEFEHNEAKFDIVFNVVPNKDIIKFTLKYKTNIFKYDTIKRISQDFLSVLEQISENPKIILSDVELLSEAKKRNVLLNLREGKQNSNNITNNRVIQEIAAEFDFNE